MNTMSTTGFDGTQESRGGNSNMHVYRPIWCQFALVRGFIAVLVFCKSDEDQSKAGDNNFPL